MVKYNKLLLSVGGNLDNSLSKFERLWKLIEKQVGHLTAISPCYQSEAWGFVSEHPFMNAAASVQTRLSPMEVLFSTQQIEKQLGRKTKSHNGSYCDRTMDIDIIGFNDLVLKQPDLEIPHPKMHLRRFVLQPLCDICPDWEHPLLHQNVRTLLEKCPDESVIKKESGVPKAHLIY